MLYLFELIQVKMKYLTSFLRYLLHLFISGRSYTTWQREYYSLKRVYLKNPKIAQELESACDKSGGVLTFSEFFAIDQYGIHGYNSTHKLLAKTGVHDLWPEALVNFASSQGYKHIVEFGSGDGNLGICLAGIAKKTNYPLRWSAVEQNVRLRNETRKKFTQSSLSPYLDQLVATVNQLKLDQPCLVFFGYSLDSTVPQVFLNNHHTRKFPNAILGVKVTGSLLEEVILSPKQLKERGLTLGDGIFRDATGQRFSLQTWQLFPRQQAFIPTHGYAILGQIFAKIPKSSRIFIVDEFRPAPTAVSSDHLGEIKNLQTFNREVDMTTVYQASGSNLYYLPLYFTSLASVLLSLGCTTIYYDIEPALAKKLIGKQWKSHKLPYCYAVIASKETESKAGIIPIAAPQWEKLSEKQKKSIVEGFPWGLTKSFS